MTKLEKLLTKRISERLHGYRKDYYIFSQEEFSGLLDEETLSILESMDQEEIINEVDSYTNHSYGYNYSEFYSLMEIYQRYILLMVDSLLDDLKQDARIFEPEYAEPVLNNKIIRAAYWKYTQG